MRGCVPWWKSVGPASWLVGAATAGMVGSLGLLQACSGDPEVTTPPPEVVPTAKVEVTVQFASDKDRSIVAVVHGWVLGADAAAAASCSRLVGGDLSPYDVLLERRAEMATMDANAMLSSEKVVLGEALVYVEASGYDGAAEFAGCVPANVVQPSTAVTVTLGKARVYDCTDAKTPDGVPCDDGKLCTVGERCKAGKCQGGTKRNCKHLADGCNAENCDEGLGCVAVPIADDTPCDDQLWCTEGDTCLQGKCLGTQRDCAADLAPCRILVGCDESQDECVTDEAPTGTACDDGQYCTVEDACTSYGQCNGQARDCSSLTTNCGEGECDEATDACVLDPYPSYYNCNDGLACTTSDDCDGNGACVGVQKNCSAWNDQCNTGTCSEPSGACQKVPVAVGTPCSDGNSGTINDQCNAQGVCQGVAPDAGVPEAGPEGGIDAAPADATAG